MTVFISGGASSGKSSAAEKIAVELSLKNKPLYYAATMLPVDGEDRERILKHRKNRAGLGFETVEIPKDIRKLTDVCQTKGTILIDSVTALLANEMFDTDFTFDFKFNKYAGEKVAMDLERVLRNSGCVVVVSDYIFSDGNIYGEQTEIYRKALALIGMRLAKACDIVIEACSGNLTIHKGADFYRRLYEKAD